MPAATEPDHEDDHQIRIRHFQGPYWLPDLDCFAHPAVHVQFPCHRRARPRLRSGGRRRVGLVLARIAARPSALLRAVAPLFAPLPRLEIFRLAGFGHALAAVLTLSPSHSGADAPRSRNDRLGAQPDARLVGCEIELVSFANCAARAALRPHCPSMSLG